MPGDRKLIRKRGAAPKSIESKWREKGQREKKTIITLVFAGQEQETQTKSQVGGIR